MPAEEEFIRHQRGKWSMTGVPHKGWTCVDIEDLGEPQTECEMCESQTIRYVHHMEHPDYSGGLTVGCVCAGHMEGSLVAAREREATMRSRTGKRARWLSRVWKTSAKGNPTIKADGFRVTVYERGGGYAATIAAVDGSRVQHARRNFPTVSRAKLAAFDHITRLLSQAHQ
ncbi:hypothetical protein AD929_00560 [Gluconobacter potus]|uniref:Uncharacterized protein n=1 Tax=Gluconobacter potus TaxID=2724927 RepID=A0A149R266_9PROT|nr:hypothetical protein [Gluconobacter potus]KXV03645.1 hypothetical protein AD929_00560 [Gluconobacter potus]